MPLTVKTIHVPVLNAVFFPPSIKLLPLIAFALNLLAFLLVMISMGSPTWSSYTRNGEFHTVGLTRLCKRMSETNMAEDPDTCINLADADGDDFKSWLSTPGGTPDGAGKTNLGACLFFTVVAFLLNFVMLPLGALGAFHFVAHFWFDRVLHIVLTACAVLQPCLQFLAWVCWIQINSDIAAQQGNTHVDLGNGWGTSFFLYVLDIVLMLLYIASMFFDSTFLPPPFPWFPKFLCSRPVEKLFDTPCCGVGQTVNDWKLGSNADEEDKAEGDDFVAPTASATTNPVGTDPSDPDAPFEVGTVVVGVFDFAGEGDDDLPFVVGARLVIVENMGESWYSASPEDDDSKTGSIPGNYVKRA